MLRRLLCWLPVAAVPSLACGALAAAAVGTAQGTVTVPSKADLFYAGLGAVPSPGLENGGVLPVVERLPSGADRVLTITHAAGSLNWGPGSPDFGADGDLTGNTLGGVTNVKGYRGISGIHMLKDQLFLAGVFLGNAQQKEPAPARLSMADASTAATLAPRLQQVFPIGDGHTTAGALQRFKVPAGATRLYLGYVDADGFSGTPGFYADNTGSLRVIFVVSR